jgi:uncharacterized membrane protein YjjP (DUF1212 family)
MDQQREDLFDVGAFVAKYATHMMGCGVHTARVVRSAKRIGESFGFATTVSVFQKNIILNLVDRQTHRSYNEVAEVPQLPISFEHNARLSALSWATYDEHLSLAELNARYEEVVNAPSIHPLFVLLLVGVANASFCRLFGGDWFSMGIVFSATMTGLFLKQKMLGAHVNGYLTFMVSAFVASLCASTALIFNTTAETAIATSVLFLVPGVPLINGVIDIVEGDILTGFSRLAKAAMLICCIAIGLSFTLMLVKDSLL